MGIFITTYSLRLLFERGIKNDETSKAVFSGTKGSSFLLDYHSGCVLYRNLSAARPDTKRMLQKKKNNHCEYFFFFVYKRANEVNLRFLADAAGGSSELEMFRSNQKPIYKWNGIASYAAAWINRAAARDSNAIPLVWVSILQCMEHCL